MCRFFGRLVASRLTAIGSDPSTPGSVSREFSMKQYAFLLAGLLCTAPVLAQESPPLKTAVDGTFAPHAMPKLGGGYEGFQIDLFTEAARRMKREIVFDAVSFSTLIPGMQSG